VIKNVFCRWEHHYLAARADPEDGEALLYLGTVLLEYIEEDHHDLSLLWVALDLFRRASVLCPCDSRIWNNRGLAVNRILQSESDFGFNKQEQQSLLEQEGFWAFSMSLDLLQRSLNSGCDVLDELYACRLNFGLFVANLDQFSKSMEILKPLVYAGIPSPKGDIQTQAATLYRYCEQRAMSTSSMVRT